MIDLQQLPLEILERVVYDLGPENCKHLTLTNQFFRKVTLPVIFKDTVYNNKGNWLNKRDDEFGISTYSLIKKYNSYIKKARVAVNDKDISIKDFKKVKDYQQVVKDIEAFKCLNEEETYIYNQLETYRLYISGGINFEFDNSILALPNLKVLHIKEFYGNRFPLTKFCSKNLVELYCKFPINDETNIFKINNNFPNLKYLEIKVNPILFTEIQLPTFVNVKHLEVIFENKPKVWLVDYFTGPTFWPNLSKLALLDSYDTFQPFKFKLDNLRTFSLQLETLIHPFDSTLFLNLTNLTLKLIKSYLDTSIPSIFLTLTQLKYLNLSGISNTSVFNFKHNVHLLTLELSSIQTLTIDLLHFVANLNLLRKLSLKYNDYNFLNLYQDEVHNLKFNSLTILKILNGQHYHLGTFIKERAPLLIIYNSEKH